MHRTAFALFMSLLLVAPAHAGEDDDRPSPHELAIEGLIEAAKKGDVGRIQRILATGIDVNAETEGGDIALHEAVAADQAAAVTALLAAGAAPNARDKIIGSLALPMAVARGRLDIARALIEAGANVNLHNRHDGETALMNAKSVEAVKLLLAHGATVNTRDRLGQTPLMHAAKSFNPDLVRLLIAAKADVTLKDLSGNTALHDAAGQGADDERQKQKEILQMLIKAGAPLLARNEYGETPFHNIMQLCDLELFKLARRAGAKLDFSNDVDLEKFHEFAGCDSSEILRIALSYPGVRDRKALLREAYFGAIGRPNLESLDILFDLGLPPATSTHVQDSFGGTKPANGVIYAAFQPRTNAALIRRLVKRGVRLEARDSFGRTALMIAAARPKLEVARAFLAAGANPNARAADGSTALMWAVDQTRGKGRQIFSGGLRWVCRGRTDMLELLLRHKADPGIRDKSGVTALQWATEADCGSNVFGGGPAAAIKLLQDASRSRR